MTDDTKALVNYLRYMSISIGMAHAGTVSRAADAIERLERELTEARERAEKLRLALRARALFVAASENPEHEIITQCLECERCWPAVEHAHHAEGCLAE